MNDRFNVFDSWGNYVGEFVPVGSGLLDSLILFVIMIILWTVGFLIYILVVLVVRGFRAARDGKWGKAFLQLLVPVLVVVIPVTVVMNNSADKATLIQQLTRQAEIKNVRIVKWGDRYQIKFTATNLSSLPLIINPKIPQQPWGFGYWAVAPGETKELTGAGDETVSQFCFSFGWIRQVGRSDRIPIKQEVIGGVYICKEVAPGLSPK